MTYEAEEPSTVGPWDPHGPTVVAVDGSRSNRAAVAWAAAEAAASDGGLLMVTALEDHLAPVPHFSVRSLDRQAHDMLDDARDEVRHVVDSRVVRSEVLSGAPVEVLLKSAGQARLLVVGKRGLGSFARVIVGSTSIAVAGRSPVPVAIVPHDWISGSHAGAPVVVGVDPHEKDQTPLLLAFQRAGRLGVPLVAVHGWETPTVYSWDTSAVAGELDRWEQEAREAFEAEVASLSSRFPGVDVRTVHRRMHPATAVLDAAENAQLVVLGRRHGGRLGGFAFGSVGRAVLHYSECPVLVVPVASEDATG